MARSNRRQRILEVAADLFHQRGYEATGIDDIGEAAGVTGPAVYRHFASKEEILETLVRQQGTAVLDEVRRIAESSSNPAEVLDALVEHYVDTILEHRQVSVISVYDRHTLRPPIRAWLERSERLAVEEWVHALTQLRPELTDAEAHFVVHAVFHMVLAVGTYRSGIDDEELAPLLRDMLRVAVASG